MIKVRVFFCFIVTNLLHYGLMQNIGLGQYAAYFVENTLQPSEQDVPLEEFFWTGSGDGPGYLKPKVSLGNDVKYPNTIVRTATILATVYIDGNYDSDFDPLCVYDCEKRSSESGIVESIDHISPLDRRYWLLTVVTGLFSPQDFPVLEEKLAKLYRIAFLRQQAKHLGLNNSNNSTASHTEEEKDSERQKRLTVEEPMISPTKAFQKYELIRTRRFVINRNVYERQVLMQQKRNHIKRELRESHPPKLMETPYEIMFKTDEKAKSSKLKNHNFMQKVSVTIHNLVHGDEDKNEIDENKINVPVDISNQTEIIYSVIVNGKPVLASTAAQDMRLVKIDEVIKIMENGVVLKAEPYLKEPQATPLIPSYMNGSSVVTTYINQNPLLIALTSIAFILFILLIVITVMYHLSKRRLVTEAKAQSTTQALVEKFQVDEDINTIRSDSLEGVGVDNLAFEKEHAKVQKKGPPVLHFPLPPASRPSSSSTSTTSDSSVYYPKRRYKVSSVQDLLDEKERKNREGEMYLKAEAKRTKNEQKQRHRRKHLIENRVGAEAIEQADVHSYQSDNCFNDESQSPYRERTESFNPRYNSNKVMSDRTFSIIESERRKSGKIEINEPTEAINKELIHGRIASGDSNSIGSFLSMASIRSFPKCTVPESLSRILEPVSVTHLDHSDADYETLKNYRMMGSQKVFDEDLARVYSDGADNGVVGPVVWEMYKKGFDLSTNSLHSPTRDPHSARNRFEGLLEGAMKLYGSSSYSNCHSLLNQQNDDQSEHQVPGVIKTKETRGKSAATIRLTSRTSGLLSRTDFNPVRPVTAGPPVVQPTQNQAPTIKAWTSGSGSLVRPLSAGVYHKPNLSVADERIEVNQARAMSASPIIDAIHKEIKRMSNDST